MSAGLAFPTGTYVVTGGAGGIGAAIVRRLQDRGVERVIVADASERGAEKIAAETGASAVVLDVSDPEQIDDFAARLAADRVEVGGLVNAAGVFPHSSFPEIEWDEWQRTLTINLTGAHFLSVGLLPVFAPNSAIVNVTSVEAFHVLSTGGATTTDYASSKGGLQTMTAALAADLGPRGIRVNAVAPGYVETPINAAVLADPQRRQVIEGRIPLGWTIGVPEQIAGPVAFLLSAEASYVTGTTMVVDGGLTIGTIRRVES